MVSAGLGAIGGQRPHGAPIIMRPNIYQHLNYREFVKEMCVFKKGINGAFSYRTFSRLAGFRSSNYLKLVCDGKRNLSPKAVGQFAKALTLTKAEAHFFEALVQYTQAKNTDDKNRHFEKITQFKNHNKIRPLLQEQHTFFSHWYYVALLELISHEDFEETPKFINKKLNLKLSAKEVEKALQTLLDLKLIKRQSNGRLEKTEELLRSSPEIAELSVINFQQEMIRRASVALDQTPVEQRDISSLTLNLTKKQFEKIQSKINFFRKELHALLEEQAGPKSVYQVNFQLFNLTEVPW